MQKSWFFFREWKYKTLHILRGFASVDHKKKDTKYNKLDAKSFVANHKENKTHSNKKLINFWALLTIWITRLKQSTAVIPVMTWSLLYTYTQTYTLYKYVRTSVFF